MTSHTARQALVILQLLGSDEITDIINQAPDPRADPVESVAKHTKPMSPLMRIIGTRVKPKVNLHFYHLPVLRIKGCYSLLTLNTPCLICGEPCSSKIHSLGDNI